MTWGNNYVLLYDIIEKRHYLGKITTPETDREDGFGIAYVYQEIRNTYFYSDDSLNMVTDDFVALSREKSIWYLKKVRDLTPEEFKEELKIFQVLNKIRNKKR